MDEGNLAILVDAKTEYTKQLVNIISPNIFVGIKNIYNQCKLKCDGSDVLYEFQILLSEIPKWNQEVINKEYDTLVEVSHCDWLEDLLTAVFVSHTRILTSINFNKNKNKINLKIPKVDHFIHLCYIEVARSFWKNPYLFDDTISKFEYQRNRRDAERIIDNTINETIRKQLPVKHILKEYLGNEFKESINNDISNPENDVEHENLRKMVKAEIENCSKEKLEKLNINNIDETNSLAEPIAEHNSLGEHNSLAEPIAEPVAEPNFLSEPNSLVEPVAEPNSLVEPVAEPVVEPNSLAEPVAEPNSLVEPLAEPNSLAEPNVELKIESAKEGLSDEEIEVENVINNEVNGLKLDSLDNNDLKIETLNLNMDDDLSNLEEVYMNPTDSSTIILEEPNNIIEPIKMKSVEAVEPVIIPDNNENKIKTVYIDTNEKKKKTSFNETDIEINYNDSEDDSYKSRKYSKKDFNFFE